MQIFGIDWCENFWDGNTSHVWGRIYKRYSPYKKKSYSYFWIRHKKKNKTFYRITNNFFIEKGKR